MCRYAPIAHAQLQMFVKTRFASFAQLLHSLLQYKDALLEAVKTPQYAAQAALAMRRGRIHGEDDDDGPEELRLLEQQLAQLETGLFNTKAPPTVLQGTKKFATVYLDLTSPRFWEAIRVCLCANSAATLLIIT